MICKACRRSEYCCAFCSSINLVVSLSVCTGSTPTGGILRGYRQHPYRGYIEGGIQAAPLQGIDAFMHVVGYTIITSSLT